MNTYISINIKTLWDTHTQEYLAIKKTEIMLLATTQLEGTVLSETNQTNTDLPQYTMEFCPNKPVSWKYPKLKMHIIHLSNIIA